MHDPGHTIDKTITKSSAASRAAVPRMDSFYLDKPNMMEPTVPTNIESVLRILYTGDPSTDAHVDLIRSVNWESYSVGPISSWPQDLAVILYFVMLAPQPRCLLVGKENLLLYNEAYGQMSRELHPRIFGRPIDEVEEWKGYTDDMKVHRQTATKVSTFSCPLFKIPMMNHGRLEEVFLSFNITPLLPPLMGFYMCFEEKTENVLRERRRSTVLELSETWSTASDLSSLWRIVLQSLSDRPEDFPIAAIYSTRTTPETRGQRGASEEDSDERTYHLEGTVGNFDNGAFPHTFEYPDTSETHLLPLKHAISTKSQVMLRIADGLPQSWSNGSLQRGNGDPCTEAVCCPSSMARYQDVEALLLIGLPTRCLVDDAHRQHMQHLQQEFAGVVNSIIATTEAAYRKKENARRHQLEKDLLAKELALRQKEAELATSQAEQVLRVIDQVDIGFFEYASTGELIRANECYYRLSGYPRDCPPDTKHKFRDLIYPEDVERVTTAWNSMLNGHCEKFELRYKNGTEGGQWALVACQPVKGVDGVVTSVIGAVTDISVQKRSERVALDRAEALEQAKAIEDRFRRTMHIAPVGCMIADVQKGVQFVNEAWWELSQHERVPVNQIDWNTVLYHEDLAIAEEGWQAMLQGEQVTYSLRLKRLWYDSDGQPRGPAEVMVTALPECDEHGKVVRVLGFTIEISHIKYQERVQRMRMEEALEARRQQERFYDTVSHEIRNPLSAVVHCADSISDALAEMAKLTHNLASRIKDTSVEDGDIQLLLDLISSSTESVETISTCSDHQRRLIHDILTLSKLDSQLLQINSSPIRAICLLNNMRKMFEIETKKENIKLELLADESIQQLGVDQVNLDSGRILQILINLITNAIKFTKNEPGPRQIKVIMGASQKRPLNLPVDWSLHMDNQESIYESPSLEGQDEFYLWFTVADAGRGMSPEEKSRIFSRFAQGSPRTYSEYGGSGLGLFISRQLVEMQSGDIGVASEPGKGSTFAFFVKTHHSEIPTEHNVTIESQSLPVRPSIRSNSKADSGVHINASEVEKSPPKKTSLLVVEDNLVNQRVLKKQLIKHGYEVHVASNGQEALDFLTSPTREIQIDCLLLDIEMPVMGGLECARRIRQWERRLSLSGSVNGSIPSPENTTTPRPKPTRGGSFTSIRSLNSVGSSNAEDGGVAQNRIPIIAISANARPEQTNDAILSGMDDSIQKPFRVADLTPLIQRNIARSGRI